MARSRKSKPAEYYRFESTSVLEQDKSGGWKHKYIDANGKKQTDTTVNICYSMLVHPAFKDLTARQKMLYVYAKSQFYGARSRPADDCKDIDELTEYQNRRCFYLNHALMSDYFGLYPKSNHRDLCNDIEALIQHGFIERVGSERRYTVGQGNGKRAIYRYSEKWKEWHK